MTAVQALHNRNLVMRKLAAGPASVAGSAFGGFTRKAGKFLKKITVGGPVKKGPYARAAEDTAKRTGQPVHYPSYTARGRGKNIKDWSAIDPEKFKQLQATGNFPKEHFRELVDPKSGLKQHMVRKRSFGGAAGFAQRNPMVVGGTALLGATMGPEAVQKYRYMQATRPQGQYYAQPGTY
jgi:hypothetical protein